LGLGIWDDPNQMFEFSFIFTTYKCFRKLLWLIHAFFLKCLKVMTRNISYFHKAANFEL
jgi:hypothetical protein